MDKYDEYQEQFLKNVLTVLRLKNIKIGEAEKQIGRKAGFISKHIKQSSNMTLRDALALSDVAGESIIDLCTKDYEIMMIEEKIEEYESILSVLHKKRRQMMGEVNE